MKIAPSISFSSRGILVGCLAGVLLMALVLRLWGLDFGLPYVEHPDESFWVNGALKIVKTGDLNPHNFIYPSLLLYVDALAYRVDYGIGRLFGAFNNLTDLVEPIILIGGTGKTSLPALFLIGRSVSLVLGLGTVALIFDLGRRYTGHLLGGVLAGLWVAISPTLVAHDRTMIPDGPMTFFTTLTLWASWRILERGRTRDYVLAGIALGLATGTKYNVVVFALPILLAHFLRLGWRGVKEWRLYAALALSGIIFLATTPYAILDFSTFLNSAFIEVRHYASGHAGNTGASLAWYVSYFWQAEGPILALAAAGMAWGIYRRSKGTLLIAATMLGYLFFISAFAVHSERTALPLVPLAILLAAGWAVDLIIPALGGPPRVGAGAVAALLVIVSLIPLVGSVSEAVRLTTPDGRDTARAWIENNLPLGAHVAIESYSPWLDPERFAIRSFYRVNGESPEWYAEQGFDYFIVSQNMFHRFYADPAQFADDIARYEALFRAFELVKTFTDGGYEVRIYRIPRATKGP
jgi:4-amino-4-deoxy-L-arabinose transferase-like glycosyltransferase